MRIILCLATSLLSIKALADTGTAALKKTIAVQQAQIGNLTRKVCSGKTAPGATEWFPYEKNPKNALVVNVDISQCGFKTTPILITSLHGVNRHWTLQGGSNPYNLDHRGFTIYILAPSEISNAIANQWSWHIQWIAVGQD